MPIHFRSLLNRFAAVTVAAFSLLLLALPTVAKDKTDVTDRVAAAVMDNALSVEASNTTFGDTAPGVPKKLTVEYRVGEEKQVAEASEGGTVTIPAPETAKLVILKAIYGPADGSRPISVENAAEVLDTLPGFAVEHVLSADA